MVAVVTEMQVLTLVCLSTKRHSLAIVVAVVVEAAETWQTALARWSRALVAACGRDFRLPQLRTDAVVKSVRPSSCLLTIHHPRQ